MLTMLWIDAIAISYVLAVLWMTSASNRQRQKKHTISDSRGAAGFDRAMNT